MTTLTVSQIAHMTGYTPRLIQLACKSGRLKATRTTRKSGWQIARADYVVWRSGFAAWQKPYRKARAS